MSLVSPSLCEAECPHGGSCTMPSDHSGPHRALLTYLNPHGPAWCEWPQVTDEYDQVTLRKVSELLQGGRSGSVARRVLDYLNERDATRPGGPA